MYISLLNHAVCIVQVNYLKASLLMMANLSSKYFKLLLENIILWRITCRQGNHTRQRRQTISDLNFLPQADIFSLSGLKKNFWIISKKLYSSGFSNVCCLSLFHISDIPNWEDGVFSSRQCWSVKERFYLKNCALCLQACYDYKGLLQMSSDHGIALIRLSL